MEVVDDVEEDELQPQAIDAKNLRPFFYFQLSNVNI